MKIIFLMCFVAMVAIYTNVNSQVIKTKLIALTNNEFVVTNESSVLSAGGQDYCIVTSAKENGVKTFYIHTKAGKKGPFTKEQVKVCNNIDTDNNESAVFEVDCNGSDTEEFVKNEDGVFTIVFKGKTFGPFDLITNFCVNKEKTMFWAVVKQGENQFLIDQNNTKIQLSGLPDGLQISADFKKAVIKTSGSMSIEEMQKMAEIAAIDPTKVDLSKLSGKTYVCSNGKKIQAGEESSPVSWFSNYNDSWFLYQSNKLHIDGDFWKDFEDISSSTFWFVNKNKYAYLSGSELIFSDGQKFSMPVKIQAQKNGGAITLQWYSIENGVLYFFKKTI